MLRAVRGTLTVVFGLLLVAGSATSAQAGTLTVTYSLGAPGFGISHEHHTGAWAEVAGGMTVTLSAMRATPFASTGFISGGTVSYLLLSGAPTHSMGGLTAWTVGLGAFGAPAAFLPSLIGAFSGLNTAGTAFAASGGFSFMNPPGTPTINVSAVGQANYASGPMFFGGFLAAFGYGAGGGSGTGLGCFNASAGSGPCFTGSGAVASSPATGTAPGFFAFGAEVERTVAIEPVPEPGTAALLALGLAGLAGGALRLRDRSR